MITRTQANRIAAVGRGPAQAQAERFERVRDKTIPSLLAYINSATPISGASYRWLYAWTRAEIKTTASGTGYDFQSRPGEAFYTGNALNICEAANTASFVGPGIDPANIPAGFDVQPISGYVHIFPMRRITSASSGGELMWCFYAPNAVDGVCE